MQILQARGACTASSASSSRTHSLASVKRVGFPGKTNAARIVRQRAAPATASMVRISGPRHGSSNSFDVGVRPALVVERRLTRLLFIQTNFLSPNEKES
eukprot:5765956-Pyramimonas_sp.AAC.2